jgi:NAD(P)-dependent dehydrogenase (short-subunit alcohol dehydrogenase family)
MEAARSWVLGDYPSANIEIAIADLSLLAETRRVGDAIAAGGRAVDVLVNNAGIFTPRREETSEGHERIIAVNHLAPFVLTRALLPALASGARIVNVGSNSSDMARITPDDLEGRRKWGVVHTYPQSKLALLMVTRVWAERLRDRGITANTVHPGAVATGLVRAGGPIGLAWRCMAPFLLTEAQGAETPLRAALAPEFAGISGAYVKKKGPVRPNRLAADADLVQRVWAATELLTGPA